MLNNGCIQLRQNLCIGKDYELMPKFLWYCLQKWNGVYGKSIERCCLSKDFLPDNRWPTIWGREEDFGNSTYFVELYPPLMEIFRHGNNSMDYTNSSLPSNFLVLKIFN